MENVQKFPPQTLKSPSAWYGQEMAKNTDIWLTYLSSKEVSEHETAAENFQSNGQDLGAMSQEDFPLPLLMAKLEKLRNNLMHGIGFELLRGLPVKQYSQRMAAAIFCGIGAYIGLPRSQNTAGRHCQRKTDL
ncbi:MAG: hypothetical protein COB93_01505 [Sneathiella sp.]|nr:MAG: hypothetical protein COB93_01505 [Sneathiella sp.]